jgi:hypothetical protein
MSPLITKEQSLKFESKTPWSTAKRPKKLRKAQEGHLEDGKLQKPANGTKSGKAKQNGKKELGKAQKSKKSLNSSQKLKRARKAQKEHKSSKSTLPQKSTPPNTLNASSPPLIVIYHVSSLNHPVRKSPTNFVPILSPFANELIKHKPWEEQDAMHENQH